jgi:hypothetical protein
MTLAPRDPHPNADGHRRLAETLAQRLAVMPALQRCRGAR